MGRRSADAYRVSQKKHGNTVVRGRSGVDYAMGDVTKVTVNASVAGSLPVSVAQEMAGAAREALKRSASITCDIAVEAYKEDRATGSAGRPELYV